MQGVEVQLKVGRGTCRRCSGLAWLCLTNSFQHIVQGEGAQATLPQNPPVTVLCATHFDSDGMLRTKGRALRSPPATPLPALFWAAGFSFSRAHLMLEVCGKLAFYHGWQIWDPVKFE